VTTVRSVEICRISFTIPALLGTETCHRLIEQKNPGLEDQRRDQLEGAFSPIGKLGHRPLAMILQIGSRQEFEPAQDLLGAPELRREARLPMLSHSPEQ
jgi:hypothetical protein